MSQIKTGCYGEILEGEPKNWFVFIQDDAVNTGGYLILFSASTNPTDSRGFDIWMENFHDVEDCFSEKGWKIKWLDNDGGQSWTETNH